MRDPHTVLGLERGASDDEIKKAYRTLSRRYHPDANINNPNKAQAEERFKEVQQAYEAIQQEKDGGGYGPGSSRGAYSGSGAGFGGYGNFGGFGGFGSFSGFGQGTGRWYYLSAAAHMGAGNNVQAKMMAQRAVEIDPGNMQYRQLLERLESGGSWYQGMGSSYGFPMESGADICPRMCLASIACSMCGPGAFCCI